MINSNNLFPFTGKDYKPFKYINPYNNLYWSNFKYNDPFLYRNILSNNTRRNKYNDGYFIQYNNNLNNSKDKLFNNFMNYFNSDYNSSFRNIINDFDEAIEDYFNSIKGVFFSEDSNLKYIYKQFSRDLMKLFNKSVLYDAYKILPREVDINQYQDDKKDSYNSVVIYNDSKFTTDDDDLYYNVTLRLPKIKREDLKINIYDNVLKISATSQYEDNNEGLKRMRTSFKHSMTLPPNVDVKHAKATFVDEILKITIPKLLK